MKIHCPDHFVCTSAVADFDLKINLSLYRIYCSWLQESKLIVTLTYFGALNATFRPASAITNA